MPFQLHNVVPRAPDSVSAPAGLAVLCGEFEAEKDKVCSGNEIDSYTVNYFVLCGTVEGVQGILRPLWGCRDALTQT